MLKGRRTNLMIAVIMLLVVVTPSVESAYAQWIQAKIINRSPNAVVIKNGQLKWGKWYDNGGNKDQVVQAPNVTVNAHSAKIAFSSSGRSWSASGTQGSVELWSQSVKIGTFVWDCPWGSKTNSYDITDKGADYVISVDGGSRYGGAIGIVSITVAYVPVNS